MSESAWIAATASSETPRERLAIQIGELAGHLAKALVATGLEHVGRQGNGPNAGIVQGADVVDRGTTRSS